MAHELEQRIGKEYQAYRVFATDLCTAKKEPKGPLAPIAKAFKRAIIEIYIGPILYAERRLVQGDSPEAIQQDSEGLLEWKRKKD